MRLLCLLSLFATLGCEADPDPVEQHPPETWFRGATHIDCPAPADAERILVCKPDRIVDHCVWTVPGCVPSGYAVIDPAAAEQPKEYGGWSPYHGVEPWHRERAMNLPVEFTGAEDPEAVQMRCTCNLDDPGLCLGPHGSCDDGPFVLEGSRSFIADWTPTRGTLGWRFGATGALVGVEVHIEVDVARGVGRVCLIGFHDSYMPMPGPQCATDGRIRLSQRPANAADAEAVFMSVEAHFARVQLNTLPNPLVEDVRIEGSAGPAPAYTYPLF